MVVSRAWRWPGPAFQKARRMDPTATDLKRVLAARAEARRAKAEDTKKAREMQRKNQIRQRQSSARKHKRSMSAMLWKASVMNDEDSQAASDTDADADEPAQND